MIHYRLDPELWDYNTMNTMSQIKAFFLREYPEGVQITITPDEATIDVQVKE